MDKCEFEHNGRRCDATASPESPFIREKEYITEFGIARCKKLCPIHYSFIVKDNIKRHNKGIDIPEEVIFLKDPSYNRLWNFFGLKLNDKKEVKKNEC